MNKAAFSLVSYQFDKVLIDFSKKISNDLNISFDPSGKFDSTNSEFELKITFYASNDEEIHNSFVQIDCIATFRFEEKTEFQELYFHCFSIYKSFY